MYKFSLRNSIAMLQLFEILSYLYESDIWNVKTKKYSI